MPRSFKSYFFISFALSLFLSLEYWALGPYSAMYGYGAGLESIPTHLGLWYSHSVHSLWAPFVGSGVDRLSFWGNTDPYNIEPLLFSFLPTWLANGLYLFLQRFLSTYFTMKVCDEHLQLPRKWCMLAGLIYAGFTYFTMGYLLCEAAIPFILWVLPRIIRTSYYWILAIFAGLLTSIGTSFLWTQPAIPIFVFLWFTWAYRERSWRLYIATFIMIMTITIADSPQFFAILYNGPYAHRANFPIPKVNWSHLSFDELFYYQLQYDFFNQSIPLRNAMTYVPRLAMILGLVIFTFQKSNRFASVFFRITMLYLFITARFFWLTVQNLAANHLFSPIRGIDIGRICYITNPFFISLIIVLCLIGVFEFFQNINLSFRKYFQRFFVGATLCGVLFMLIWPKIALFYPLLVNSWGEKNYQIHALEQIKQNEALGTYRVASVLSLQPGYAYGQGLEAADGWAAMFPAVYREYWLRLVSPVMNAIPQVKAAFDPPGRKPQDHFIFLGLGLVQPYGLMPGESKEDSLIHGFDIDRRFKLPLLSLLNVKYLLSEFPLKSQQIRLVHKSNILANVDCIEDYAIGISWCGYYQYSQNPWIDLKRAIQRKKKGKDIYIYENTKVLPRFRFVQNVKTMETSKEVLDTLEKMDETALIKSALMERKELAFKIPSSLSNGEIKAIKYTPDEIVLQIKTAGSGVVAAAMTWNPFWTASSNGSSSRPMFRLNHAQMGILVEKEDTLLTLRYLPPYHKALLK